MPLDSKKLRHDALRLQKARGTSSVGRETTGTSKAVREALPTIHQLRKDGVSWAMIAQALAEQGVVQGKDRIPLTTHRLTALVTQIEAQQRKKALKVGPRDRGDTVEHPAVQRLTFSPDLVSPAETPNAPRLATEEDLRRAALEKLQTVLKKE
ncbi:hypothetical protein HAP41_0000003530 [Bradyrhizobium barranii subsp. apii]|uniref:Uncharacterized protein n=1 Tax=Bradyrhizobium barranii subsp. apii TaxID=2819348 RepID=A0A8T5V2Z2_9BRAD|nr:hypothetical protein [Bradyrhizobium barranii]UPT88228.1 hypothetical protein HAP41_0000003530 [Bradyrhizobium barranii subsp. apii]